MSSPVPTLLLCLSYAYISKSLGPKLMANRKPFQLRHVLVYYNLFQTIFSAWIVYEASVLLHNLYTFCVRHCYLLYSYLVLFLAVFNEWMVG